MGTRSGAERDAITVEIGFALVSAVFVAVVSFVCVVAPAWLLDLPRAIELALVYAGAVIAVVAFVARTVHVLWRFRGRPDQPSQPGRTSPDS